MILKLLTKFRFVGFIILTDTIYGKKKLSIKIKDNSGYHSYIYPFILGGYIRLNGNGDCYGPTYGSITKIRMKEPYKWGDYVNAVDN